MITCYVINGEKSKVKLKLPPTFRIKDLIVKLKINGTSHLFTKNDELVLEDEILRDGDVIGIVKVGSGG